MIYNLVTIDVGASTSKPVVDIYQDSVNSHMLLIKLIKNDKFHSIPNSTAKILFNDKETGELIVSDTVRIINDYRGLLSYIIGPALLQNFGRYSVTLEIITENVQSSIYTFILNVVKKTTISEETDDDYEVTISKEFLDELNEHLTNKIIHIDESLHNLLDFLASGDIISTLVTYGTYNNIYELLSSSPDFNILVSTKVDEALQPYLDSFYVKPADGIPESDLSEEVQRSLDLADSALQDLPIASAETLGGIKIGENLTIDENGVLSAQSTDVAWIESLIPSQASPENQLADKNFVNSSVATNTAYFVGTFASLQLLTLYDGEITNNDYAFVVIYNESDPTQVDAYDRYKYNAQEYGYIAVDELEAPAWEADTYYSYDHDNAEYVLTTEQPEDWSTSWNNYFIEKTTPGCWLFEYELNNSSFTAEQWAAINSSITSDLVTSYSNHIANTTIHVTSTDKSNWNAKYTKPASGIPESDLSSSVITKLNSSITAGTGLIKDGNTISVDYGESGEKYIKLEAHGYFSYETPFNGVVDDYTFTIVLKSDTSVFETNVLGETMGFLTGTPYINMNTGVVSFINDQYQVVTPSLSYTFEDNVLYTIKYTVGALVNGVSTISVSINGENIGTLSGYMPAMCYGVFYRYLLRSFVYEKTGIDFSQYNVYADDYDVGDQVSLFSDALVIQQGESRRGAYIGGNQIRVSTDGVISYVEDPTKHTITYEITYYDNPSLEDKQFIINTISEILNSSTGSNVLLNLGTVKVPAIIGSNHSVTAVYGDYYYFIYAPNVNSYRQVKSLVDEIFTFTWYNSPTAPDIAKNVEEFKRFEDILSSLSIQNRIDDVCILKINAPELSIPDPDNPDTSGASYIGWYGKDTWGDYLYVSFISNALVCTFKYDTFNETIQQYTSALPIPTASANTLGGIKVGSGLSIDANGVLSATAGSSLPVYVLNWLYVPQGASDYNPVEVAENIEILNTISQLDAGDYLLYIKVNTDYAPAAVYSTDTFGAYALIFDTADYPVCFDISGTTSANYLQSKISNCNISTFDPADTENPASQYSTAQYIASQAYTLPKASASTLGGVKVGTGLTIDAQTGVLSATGGGSYVLPTASASTLGGIKVGNNLSIDANGVLSADSGFTMTISGTRVITTSTYAQMMQQAIGGTY